jgi:hypothetical protein
MPAATNSSKVKHPYHTDHAYEEQIQATKLDVEENNIQTCTVVHLHQVRLNCAHCQLTSFKSSGSLWNVVGSLAWMHV